MSIPCATAESSPRIVKAHAAGPLGTPVAFNYSDLRRACDEHLADVQDKSRRIVDGATGEAERIRKQAFEAGRRDGYRDGLKAAEAEAAGRVERLAAERLATQLETVLPAVRQVAEEMKVERDRWAARWESEAVRLAVAIAERMVRHRVATDPTAADRLIADTLHLAAGAPHLTVKLSPEDHERLGGSVETLAGAAGKLGTAEVVADPRITPGGCVLATRHGRVDGRLETQLDRIAAELIGSTESPK